MMLQGLVNDLTVYHPESFPLLGVDIEPMTGFHFTLDSLLLSSVKGERLKDVRFPNDTDEGASSSYVS